MPHSSKCRGEKNAKSELRAEQERKKKKKRSWRGFTFKFYIPFSTHTQSYTGHMVHGPDMELRVSLNKRCLSLRPLTVNTHTHTLVYSPDKRKHKAANATHQSRFYETFVSAGLPCAQHQLKDGPIKLWFMARHFTAASPTPPPPAKAAAHTHTKKKPLSLH